jgi:hypothetical protein
MNVTPAGLSSAFTIQVTSVQDDGVINFSLPAGIATDAAGNPNASTSAVNSITLDRSAPHVLSITRSGVTPTNSNQVSFAVAFSEAVLNVGQNDFSIQKPAGSPASIAAVVGSGDSYVVTLNTGTVDGSLGLSFVDDDSVADSAANPVGGPGAGNGNFTGEAYLVDKTSPTAVISSTLAPGPTDVNPMPAIITFSEPVQNFSLAELTVTNGVSGNLATADNLTFTFDITPALNPTQIQIGLDSGKVQDLAGNANVAATPLTVNFSSSKPTVVINSGQASTTSNSLIQLSVSFSVPVTGFDQNDVQLSNATISAFSGSGASYSITLSPIAEGSVSAQIKANAAIDAGSNFNSVSNLIEFQYDPIRPNLINVIVSGMLQVDIGFSEPIANGALIPQNYTLSGTGMGTLGSHPDSVISLTSTTYRLHWNSGEMKNGGNIIIQAINLSDAAGNSLQISTLQASTTATGVPPTSFLTAIQDYTQAHAQVSLQFASNDLGGSGIASTRLLIKLPGASAFSDAGLNSVNLSGSFTYTALQSGVFEFITRALDQAGNEEDISGKSSTRVIVNIQPNAAFTYLVTSATQTLVFPMTDDLDVTITLRQGAIGGSITVGRMVSLASWPAPLNSATALKEALTISQIGLGAFQADLFWATDSASASELSHPLKYLFQYENGNLVHQYNVNRDQNILRVFNIDSFSEWYAGFAATAAIGWVDYE